MNKILIVDGQELVTEPLTYLLQQAGFAVVVRPSGPAALAELTAHGADLVLLDLALPDPVMTGFQVCQRLRAAAAVPIIILTASDSEADKVTALEAGADDYLTKPFSSRELVARITAVQRRYDAQDRTSAEAVLVAGPVRIDVPRHRVSIDGAEVSLRLEESPCSNYLSVTGGTWSAADSSSNGSGGNTTTETETSRRDHQPAPHQTRGRPRQPPPPADHSGPGIPVPTINPAGHDRRRPRCLHTHPRHLIHQPDESVGSRYDSRTGPSR